MPTEHPPTIDPNAAARWAVTSQGQSAWLHEEVARRMVERLQWIRLQPASWADWEPTRGGLLAHAAVAGRYPAAACYVLEPTRARAATAAQALARPWWSALRRSRGPVHFAAPPDGTVDMMWANMSLHMAADPQDLISRWHRALAPQGFLMFSCLGPDTLRELRGLYQSRGWCAPAHEFTDMHDWGDMLVNAGFAEPVMDMERITLTFASGERLLAELRQLGRNLHIGRFAALRGRAWREQLLGDLLLGKPAGEPGGPLALTFEVIYGHAIKPAPRLPIQGETTLSLDEMRRVLQQGKGSTGRRP